jgi:NADPH-dependent 2,4-dienoyl-CoA reductase/sulfur reductase-like enzyme/rhodanese-related sulfurtransferase
MSPKRIVVVGGVAGGASCAARARRLSEDATIVMFERGPHVSFANCGLPYHIGGEIADKNKLLVQTPEKLRATLALDVRVRTEVTAIDRAARRVEWRRTDTGETGTEPYDALVLAPGAAPLRPPIPGIDRPGHFSLRNIPDMEAILDWIARHPVRRAVVVGGGYIGLEMVEQLHRLKIEIALAEAGPQVMAPLDADMAELLHVALANHGVETHLGDGVAGFEAPGDGESALASVVVLRSGKRLPGDLVILGLGVRPEVGLAKAAGLELGATGGIKVDAHMRTSDPAIYAVGDAVEVTHRVTGRPVLLPLAGPANRQGRVAADNIFGIESRFPGSMGTAVLRLFEEVVACTGANSRQLEQAGMAFRAVHLHPGSHAGYYPGAQPIAMKLLFDPVTRRVLGAQAVGRDGVEKRIDVIATAIAGDMTVDDLAELELCYAPPFGSAKDPVNMAGMAAQNVAGGLVKLVHWNEVDALVADGAVLVDVRDARETAGGVIPGALNIPLGELRDRLGELPADRPLVTYCQSGLRSYLAARLLGQRGWNVHSLSGSWRTWTQVRRLREKA